VELIVTVSMLAILTAIAVPSFTSLIAKTKADSDISELYRSLNFARSEAINRGVAIRVVPVINGQWVGIINVQIGPAALADTLLRVLPAMSTTAVLTATSTNGPASFIEFNNLGALNFPLAPVAISYTRGTQVRSMAVCLNGRVLSGATSC
jgi:type IV fimbrial biogenesis protein FimU